MSKITDINQVQAYAYDVLDELDYTIVEMCGRDVAALLVTNIYMMSDLTSGFGQDIVATITIISSPKRISAIFDGHMSFFQVNEGICGYLDLTEDLRSICTVMQAAIERVNAGM